MTTFRFLDAPATVESALGALPQLLARWFHGCFGEPTVIQRLAWPALASGGHLLISAPTGTGKTLAALMPMLAELLAPFEPADWSTSRLRVLYLAPLKALVNDAARNLQAHLAGIASHLPRGTPLPRVAVRTGDTSGLERRRLHDEPPDVLLTTPESLAVLLSQGQGAGLFANLAWVVVDEVHALAGNKRGAGLAVSLERLTALAHSPPRRVGLSATATPLAEAGRYLVGARHDCNIVRTVHAPPSLRLEPLPNGNRFLSALVARMADELPRHCAVLVFTNTRALAERLAWSLRRKLPDWDDLIAVHHSALSAPRRRDVEERFKDGELRAVVSSTSLELGIDIGSVDLAVLVHPPGDVVRLLQRVGRAGHEPGAPRQGLVLTATAAELLEAAVTLASGLAGQCEPLRLCAAPLDVLCQQILGMCCGRSWSADDLYELVCGAAPYTELARGDFDDCLAYLRGLDRHGESWLPARLIEDGDCFRVADGRTARILRRNIGTILAEVTVPVVIQQARRASEERLARRASEGADGVSCFQVGEVDESFADRLQPGDRFLLDGRCLEFRAREKGSAVVEEVAGRPRTPVWVSDGWPLSPELARRLYLLRTRAAEALREGPAALSDLLRLEYGLDADALAAIVAHFQQQECVSEIPDATTLLIEVVSCDRGLELYLHTPLNRPGNDALARVAVARLVRDHGRSTKSIVADLGLVLLFRGAVADVPALVRSLLAAEGFADELDRAVAQSESLRARFGRVAQTGLMLLRQPEGRRRRVGGANWGEKHLFENVRQRDPDFVLIRQALSELRQELCDLPQALDYARRLPALTVRCRCLFRPSPFAAAWTQADAGATDSVLTPDEALQRLHAQLTGGTGQTGAG